MTKDAITVNSSALRIHSFYCEACLLHNATIVAAWRHLDDDALIRKTHYFHGRHENLYVNPDLLPGLDFILARAIQYAADILGRPEDTLKIGFWFNEMHEGDITTRHSHDDDDELLSGVYYVQVPEASGLFRYFTEKRSAEIEPCSGTFLFFNPDIEHDVTAHRAKQRRLSIGMNIGPAG